VRLPKRHNRLNVQQQNNHPVLQPLYRSTCLSQHLHIRIGGFCWCKVLLPTCSADGNQHIHIREKTLEFSSTLSLYLIYMYLRLNVTHIHTHTLPFNGSLSATTRVSQYQKGKTNLDFTEARDSEWQWHQLGHMQACNSFQTGNHASTPPLSFLQAGCP